MTPSPLALPKIFFNTEVRLKISYKEAVIWCQLCLHFSFPVQIWTSDLELKCPAFHTDLFRQIYHHIFIKKICQECDAPQQYQALYRIGHTIYSKQHKMQRDRLTISASHIQDEAFQIVIKSDIKHFANKEKLFTFRGQKFSFPQEQLIAASSWLSE